ncbi:unnamed protein product [Rhizophagus irregularis]|nr:unnamed protein product [Rhizophagus irregularis]
MMNENKYNELHMSDVLLSEQQQLNNKNHSSTLIEGTITDESIGESIGDIKFAGFSLRRKRVEADKDGVVWCGTFECSFSGKSVSNQVIDITHQRERASKKIMCPWHINLTKLKSSMEISITSIIGQHNHSMIADAQLYIPKYCRLSDDVIEKINFYVTKGNMGAKQIYPLLVAGFPDQYIHKRDLYNMIQKFKSSLTNRYRDAQNMINKLFELKDQEPGWIIHTRLDPFDNRLVGLFWMSPSQHQCLLQYNDVIQTDNICRTNWFYMYLTFLVVIDNNTKSRLVAQCLSEDETIESYEWFLDCFLQATNDNPPVCLFSDADPALTNAIALKLPRTHHFLCIFHIQENLRKNLAGKLGKEYQTFYKEFLHTRNSLFLDDFSHRWTRLLEKYPQTQEYLNRTLNNCCQAWAKCYQVKHFTAGIQSTQRVEVMNRLIKEGTSSISSLCNLHEQIQKLLDNEAQWSRHNAYLQSLPTNQTPSIIEPIFPKIVELMKKYLTPHILSVQQQQILGSLLVYRAKTISKDLISTIKDDDQCNYNEGFIED